MTIANKLLADVIIFGMLCGLYLQYKGFTALCAVPALAEHRNRALSYDEMLKLVESIAYTFTGAFFETISLVHAVFA